MGLRFDPMGGGQFQNALKAIMEVEKQPIKALEGKKKLEETRMKLFQDFKTKFSAVSGTIQEISSFKKFRELKAEVGAGKDLVEVTLDKEKAQPGNFLMRIDSTARRPSMLSMGFKDPEDMDLGIGFVKMYLNDGDSREIYIDQNNANLKGIANIVNNEPECPVRANIVKDMSNPEKPFKLMLVGKKDGEVNDIEFPEFYFLDGDDEFWIGADREASNAIIRLDDYEIEAESNDVNDFLPGINLHIKQANDDLEFTLNIQPDYEKITGKVKAVVDAMNEILDFINKQNQIDEKTDTKSTFAGDTGLQIIEYRMRNLLHEAFPRSDDDPDSDEFKVLHLHEVGLSFDKKGKVNFDEKKFQTEIEKDFDGIAYAMTSEMGFANQLRFVVDSFVAPGRGILPLRERIMKEKARALDDQIDTAQSRVDRKGQMLVEKFSRLQGQLNGMQRQQQALSATLGGGGGGNIVSQLLGGIGG